MKRILVASLLAAYAALGSAGDPVPVMPMNLHWISPSEVPGLQFAWVLGAESRPEPYVLRVKLNPGTTIVPHFHPDGRTTTVLDGTLYVAFTDTLDVTKAVAIPAGTMYVTPANTPHFVMTKDGGTLYQEFGSGPTGTTPIRP